MLAAKTKDELWANVRGEALPPRGRAALPVLACARLGAPTGETRPCQTCSGHVEAKLFACAAHGVCTIAKPVDAGVMDCTRCRREGLGYTPAGGREVEVAVPVAAAHPTPPHRFEWVSTRRLVADAIRLAALLPLNCAGVVGVPRSGVIPASVIATHLHLPLFTFDAGELRHCHVGASRGNVARGGAGPLAVVDDTTFSGSAMKRTRDLMRGQPAVYCAVYVNPLRPQSVRAVDHYAVKLPAPHLLEWNWANNGPFAGAWADVPAYGRGIAVDLDGVVVHDEHSGGRPGGPYLVPRMHPCPLIVTGRHERHRRDTEAMLRGLGVRWHRLEMLPDHVTLSVETAAQHKAKYFAASGCGLFVESCPDQAREIHRLSGRPVICPRAERVFQAGDQT